MVLDAVEKPTLLSIRLKTGINTQQLADMAGVKLAEAYVVEIGGFVGKEVAEKVLTAFSQLSGIMVHLNDIRLHNVSESVSRNTSLCDLPTTKDATPYQNK